MRRHSPPLSLFALFACLVSPHRLTAQDSGARPLDRLQRELGDTGTDKRWRYGDLGAARAEAAKTKRPLLALFRCVP